MCHADIRLTAPVFNGITNWVAQLTGPVMYNALGLSITRAVAGQTVYLVETNDYLLVFDDQGTQIMRHRWPKPGVKYFSSGGPRGRQPKQI